MYIYIYYPLFFIKYHSVNFNIFFKPLLRKKYFLVEILCKFTRIKPQNTWYSFLRLLYVKCVFMACIGTPLTLPCIRCSKYENVKR